MAGWTTPDKENTSWEGTVKADKVKADLINTGDFTSSSAAYVANVVYGTGSVAPTASDFPIGTIFIEYTP